MNTCLIAVVVLCNSICIFGFDGGFQPKVAESDMVFVGNMHFGKAFFAFPSQPYMWIESYDTCRGRGMIPATIENAGDNEIITTFLNSSATITSFWLAATDHATESTFKWVYSKEGLSYANWADGMPSNNRSANCLIINVEGKWVQTSCSDSSLHYTLCEMHTFKSNSLFDMNAVSSTILDKSSETKNGVPISPKMTPIGGIGNKLYFTDDTVFKRFNEMLDYCHTFGMRMAAPETPEELNYLSNTIIEQCRNGGECVYLLGATDMLSMDCMISNKSMRWFYTGNELNNQTFHQPTYRYICVIITPGGLSTPHCIGYIGPVLCELAT